MNIIDIDQAAAEIVNIERQTARETEVTRQLDAAKQKLLDDDKAQTERENQAEARGDAAVAAVFGLLAAKVTVTFADRRFVLDMGHRDVVLRETGIEGLKRLTRFFAWKIEKIANGAYTIGRNGGTFDLNAALGTNWVESLLASDDMLRPAFVRGLLTVTDLKGKPVKLNTQVKKTTTTTTTTDRVPDAWLGR